MHSHSCLRFDLLELLLAGRTSIMNAVGSAAGAAQAMTAAAAAARVAGLPGAGLGLIHEIKTACAARAAAGGIAATASVAVSASDAAWREEEAALLWADGQYELALNLARALVGAQRHEVGGIMRKASLLVTLGSWLAERNDESSSRIQAGCFDEAIALLRQVGKSQRHQDARLGAAQCDAHFQLAKFLDNVTRRCVCHFSQRCTMCTQSAAYVYARVSRMCRLEERMTSPEWEHALKLRNSAEAELKDHQQKYGVARSVRIFPMGLRA